MPLLGRVQNTGTATTITVDLPQGYQVFEIIARVSGYTGSEIAKLQFNRDTGTNYSFRGQVSTSVTNTTGLSVNGIEIATVAITGARGLIWARVDKRLASLTARVIGHTHSDNEAAAAAPLMYQFMGNWNNTTSLITSVSLTGDSTTLLANSYLEVWGALDTH